MASVNKHHGELGLVAGADAPCRASIDSREAAGHGVAGQPSIGLPSALCTRQTSASTWVMARMALGSAGWACGPG
jgi:hypothetical protein